MVNTFTTSLGSEWKKKTVLWAEIKILNMFILNFKMCSHGIRQVGFNGGGEGGEKGGLIWIAKNEVL